MTQKKYNSPYDWDFFCNYILRKNRFVLNGKWSEFLDLILSSAKKREETIERGSKVVRARIGSYYKETEDEEGGMSIISGPLKRKELLAPPTDKAKNGRINPRGISYLYCANNYETALIEVRPWLGQKVSVGIFKIKKDLRVVDTSQDKKKLCIDFGEKLSDRSQEQMEECIWGDINHSFSKPIRPEEENIAYIPTQYLSELFKTNGYDGIIYKSALTEEGYNIVLFDPNNAELTGARVFEITSIKQEFEESDPPYFYKR